jgi:hypothetical protein
MRTNKVSKEITRSLRQNQLEKERKNTKIIQKHISSAAIESHLQTSAVYGGQMRKNNITIEETRKKQGLTELQFDPLRRQELQQTHSVQCGINPRSHLRNLTTIDNHPHVSNGITPWNLLRIPKNKLGSTMPTAEFEITIACDLRGLSNNPLSADH